MVAAVYDVAEEVYPLAAGENPLVGLYLQPHGLQPPLHNVAVPPKGLFVARQDDTVIAIAVVVWNRQFILYVVVEYHGEQQIGQPLRTAQPKAEAVGYQPHEFLQQDNQNRVFEHPAHTAHDFVLVDVLVELADVELVAVGRAFRVALHVVADIGHQVVHPAPLDACAGGADKTWAQVFVHHAHHGVNANTFDLWKNLEVAHFPRLHNLPVLPGSQLEGSLSKLFLQLGYHLVAVFQYVPPFGGLLSDGAT